MLSSKELQDIRERFQKAGADKPLRIEGEHLQEEGYPLSLEDISPERLIRRW